MNPPSRFIQEIPQKLVDFKSMAPRMPTFASRGGNFNANSQGFSQGWNSKAKFRQDESQEFPDYEFESQSFAESAPGADYNKGQKVKHPTFGVGTIFSVEGAGDQTKVGVMFSDQTIKKFVVKYARLEKI